MAWAGSGLLLTTASEALPDPLCLICLQLTSSTSPRPQSSLRCQEATPPWKCPSHSTHTQPLLQLWPFFYQPCPHPPSHNAPLSSRLAKAPACFFSLCPGLVAVPARAHPPPLKQAKGPWKRSGPLKTGHSPPCQSLGLVHRYPQPSHTPSPNRSVLTPFYRWENRASGNKGFCQGHRARGKQNRDLNSGPLRSSF